MSRIGAAASLRCSHVLYSTAGGPSVRYGIIRESENQARGQRPATTGENGRSRGMCNLRHRMSLFANYRADRLIAEVKSSGNPSSPLAQKALEKLVALGPSAIEPIVEALTTAEKRETLAYVEALSRLIDSKTLPHLLKTMAEANGRAMSGIAWALSSSRSYPASALARRLEQAGHAEAGDSRCDRRAESPLHGARTVERRLRPGGQRAIGPVQDHRRNRR